MNEMRMLLWKDLRLSQVCLIAGIIAVFMPYLFLFIPESQYEIIWALSVFVSQATMAIMAGNIIACERSDRSALFLAYQGASRKKVVSSKLIICVFVFILVCMITSALSVLCPLEAILKRTLANARHSGNGRFLHIWLLLVVIVITIQPFARNNFRYYFFDSHDVICNVDLYV